ncbi:MAG: hypothetical protein IJQ01_05865 [Selenomonadaceae bacterium]|nr:hypothetical protein [Selenomonadaceae bacterium]
MKFIRPYTQEYYINVAHVRRFVREAFNDGDSYIWYVEAEMDDGKIEVLEEFDSHDDAMKYLNGLVKGLSEKV